jgi:ABC-type dipeptide/oligopeptide/nickel transport system ATPase component
MSKYKGYCIAIVGTNGTGKSTFMKEIMDRYPSQKNVLLLMDDDSEEMFDYLTEITAEQIPYYRGQAVCFAGDSKKEKEFTFTQIYQGLGKDRNGKFNGALLCIDDAMSILTTRDDFVMRIFKKRRQRKMDIIINCHGASEYPISLFRNTTHFVVCKTTDSYDQITKRMNKELAEDFVKVVNYVNKRAEENPYFKMIFDLKNPKKLPENV